MPHILKIAAAHCVKAKTKAGGGESSKNRISKIASVEVGNRAETGGKEASQRGPRQRRKAGRRTEARGV